MKLNKEAKKYFCLVCAKELPTNGWSIELLDADVSNIDINRIYKRNVITNTGFFEVEVADGEIKAVGRIMLKPERSAVAKSALIEFGDGALMLMTAGSGRELSLSSPMLHPLSIIYIDCLGISCVLD